MQTILYNKTDNTIKDILEAKAYRKENDIIYFSDNSFISGLNTNIGVLALQEDLEISESENVKDFSLNAEQTEITNGINTYSLPPKFNLTIGISRDTFLSRLKSAENDILTSSYLAEIKDTYPVLNSIYEGNNKPLYLIFHQAWQRFIIADSIDNTDQGLRDLLTLASAYNLLVTEGDQTQAERLEEILNF